METESNVANRMLFQNLPYCHIGKGILAPRQPPAVPQRPKPDATGGNAKVRMPAADADTSQMGAAAAAPEKESLASLRSAAPAHSAPQNGSTTAGVEAHSANAAPANPDVLVGGTAASTPFGQNHAHDRRMSAPGVPDPHG
jgi:hypothetical protein